MCAMISGLFIGSNDGRPLQAYKENRVTLNINISEISGPIATKFYLKHHWVEGKAALGFEQDRSGRPFMGSSSC